MSNDVWLKIAQFLGTLNGENINRKSYVRTPEDDVCVYESRKIGQYTGEENVSRFQIFYSLKYCFGSWSSYPRAMFS